MSSSRALSRFAPFLLLGLVSACGDSGPTEDPSTAYAAACAQVNCGAGRCVLDGEQAACLCDEGYRAEALSCVQATVANPCEPDPCAQQVRSVCSVVAAKAVCSCPAGHAPVGDSCSAQRAFDCAERAPAGTGDAAEPDACPTLARALMMNAAAEARTLAPAGDSDWIALATRAGHVYAVSTVSGQLGLVVDVLSGDGFTVLAFDSLGGADTAVRFRATGASHMVRVRALDAAATGTYHIQVSDLGPDDFADSAADAREQPVGTSLLGSLQFSGDVDVMKLSLVAGRSYDLLATADSSAAASLVLELLSADGATLLRRSSGAPAHLQPLISSSGTFALRVRSGTAQALGSYSVTVRDLGEDDHGNQPIEATPLQAGSSGTAGKLERTSDVDVFTLTAQAGFAYRFAFQSSNYATYRLRVLDEQGTVLLQRNDNSWQSELVLKAPKAGPLYLEVSGALAGATYSVSGEKLGEDDHGDTLATATALAFSTALTPAVLLHHGDVDVFSFPAVSGHIYRFTCTAQSSEVSCTVRLKSATGATLVTSAGSYGGAVAGYEALEGGTLYAEVFSGWASSRGAYSVRVEDVGVDDHGDTPESASALVPGSPAAEARFELSGDVDAFSFEGLAGHAYQFSCTPAGTTDCRVRLRNAAGELVASTDTQGMPLAYEVGTAQRFTVETFSSPGQSNGGFGTYSFRLVDLGLDDHGNDLASGTELSAGADGTGVLAVHADVDVFRFSAPANHVVRFTCTRPGTQYGCSLRLKNAATGALLDSTRGNVTYEGGSSDVALYVEVYRDYYEALGSYGYQLRDLGPEDHGDTLATATALAPSSEPLTGELETIGDVDVFQLALGGGHIYRFECSAPSQGCMLRLRSAGGALIREGYGTLEHEALADETRYLELSSGYSGSRGSYSLRFSDLGLDDHGDDAQTATALELGATAVGNLETAQDVDAFQVSLTAGVTYKVAPLDTLSTSVLAPDGSTLLYADYTSSGGRTFTPTATGLHTVLVRRYWSDTRSYQLSVR